MKQIGIDLGSSFIKYAVFDMDKHTLLYHSKLPSVPAQMSSDGKFEISAEAIVKQVKYIISSAMDSFDDVSGVVFSTQMHGFIFHTDNGQPDIYISWQDQRSQNLKPGEAYTWLNYLKDKFPAELMKQTGVQIKTALALCNMFILTQEQYGTCPNGEFFTLGSYVIKSLIGNNICHITNAAPSGMVNIYEKDWSQEIISKAGFDQVRFPKILCGFGECGEYFVNGKKIRIYLDFGDQQTSILGCNPNLNDIVVNIGTAAQICQVVDKIIPNGYEVRPFFENLYLNTISNVPGGRSFEYYLDFISDVGTVFFGREAQKSDLWAILDNNENWQSEGLDVDLNFYDIRDGSASSGTITNITPVNFKCSSVTAASYEGIAKEYLHCYELLTRGTKKPSRILLAGGKLSRQRMMVNTISRYFDIPVISSPKAESVFEGLFRIAQVCCGAAKNLAETDNLVSN